MKEILENVLYVNIIKTILTIGIGYFVRQLVVKIMHKRLEDQKLYYRTKKMITYVYFTAIIIILFVIWTESSSIGTYLGLTSAGLAIALKDLIINIAAWFFILFKKPFAVGDRIEINGQAGDVIDQRLFQFTIMEIGKWVESDQSTGRIVHLPNSVVFNYPLASFTGGFEYIWHEIHVMLTFESDYKLAKKLFLKLAEDVSLDPEKMEKEIKAATKQYMIFYSNLTPIVYTDVKDSGVVLSIRYLCQPHQRRTSNNKMWESILDITQAHDNIDLAYPTIRMTK